MELRHGDIFSDIHKKESYRQHYSFRKANIYNVILKIITLCKNEIIVSIKNDKICHQSYSSLPLRANRPRTLNYSLPFLAHVQNNKEVHTLSALIIFSYKLQFVQLTFFNAFSKLTYIRSLFFKH